MNSRLLIAALASAVLAGCGKKPVHVSRTVPPPPPIADNRPPEPPARSVPAPPAPVEPADDTPGRILYSETGIASWYGTVYHNRRAANGEIYDQNGMTAAHKTLPINSTVRVTNLQNGKSAVVRITDRGPFVGERIIDLSVAAAKEIGSYLPGTARVRVDVLEAPKDIATGGRWCVQIGAFDSYAKAAAVKEQLVRRYRSAKVLQFTGPTGEWLRVRVLDDDKERAYALAKDNPIESGVFVVRLD